MVYVVVKMPPTYHQMTLEKFLFQTSTTPGVINENLTNTRTYEMEYVSDRVERKLGISIGRIILKLEAFNTSDVVDRIKSKPRQESYYKFYIPKKSGGLREINAPEDDLMSALRTLKGIFENDCKALYHTSAFAYIKKRSTLDAVKRHQSNESKWFCKYDLHDFFGSTTLEFIMQMFSMVYPFSEVVKTERGRSALESALELAILNGGLPQGTPISPLITNIMMIPIDYKLSKELRDFDKQRFVYTRYADDFIISSRYDFDFRKIEQEIISSLATFNAPFQLNTAKTRYGSSSGHNFLLGCCLNGQNEITIGHKTKRRFQAMLTNYVKDRQNGNPWDLEDIQVMNGLYNYYKMVEGRKIDELVGYLGDKLGCGSIKKLIKEDLAG